MSCRKKKRGFTLLEMVIAVAILLLLAGIGVASYRRYQWSINLRDTRNSLMADIKFTQQMAIQNPNPDPLGREVDYRIEVNNIQHKYYIRVYHYGSGSHDELKKTVKTVPFPLSVNIGVTNDMFSFRQAGVPFQGGVVITVTEINLNKNKTIEISTKGAISSKE